MDHLKNGFNALGGNFWVDNIEMYELYEQMRQRNARVYADRLNRLQEGDQTPEDIAFFGSLKIDRNNPLADYNVFIKHLFATNVQLDAHNEMVYNMSDTLAIQCKARDTFVARNLSMERRQILQSVLEGVEPKNVYGLHKTLNLRLGLLVQVVLNEDVSDGIFNGAYGHLRSVTLDERDVPSRLWVKFANERIGQQLCKRFSNLKPTLVPNVGSSTSSNENWTALYPISRCHRITKMQDSEVRRLHFPIWLATACTFNRAQGATLKIAAMDFQGMPSAGRHYVGLSRLTSPDNCFIFNFDAESIRTSAKVKIEMKRLRNNQRVTIKVPNLVNDYLESVMLVAHNGRSLHAHIVEVRADINFKEADFILHTETRATAFDKNDLYDLDGFKIVRADALVQDGDPVRPHHGTAIHYRENIDCESLQVHSQKGLDPLEQLIP